MNFIQEINLLDSCSEINYVSFDFEKRNRMLKTKVFASVSGLNGPDTALDYKIETMIANKDRDVTREIDFLMCRKITEIIPIALIRV